MKYPFFLKLIRIAGTIASLIVLVPTKPINANSSSDYLVKEALVPVARNSGEVTKINVFSRLVFSKRQPSLGTFLMFHGGPGLPQTPIEDSKFVQELLEDYDVIEFHQRGCGKSRPVRRVNDPFLKDVTIENIAADAEAVRRHFLGSAPVIAMGKSWGVAVASSYAVNYSDSVSALVAASGRFESYEDSSMPTPNDGEIDSEKDKALKKRSKPSFEDITSNHLIRYLEQSELGFDVRAKVAAFQKPVFIFTGEFDTELPAKYLFDYARELSRNGTPIQATIFLHAGHGVTWEWPERAIKVLSVFLKRHLHNQAIAACDNLISGTKSLFFLKGRNRL